MSANNNPLGLKCHPFCLQCKDLTTINFYKCNSKYCTKIICKDCLLKYLVENKNKWICKYCEEKQQEDKRIEAWLDLIKDIVNQK